MASEGAQASEASPAATKHDAPTAAGHESETGAAHPGSAAASRAGDEGDHLDDRRERDIHTCMTDQKSEGCSQWSSSSPKSTGS